MKPQALAQLDLLAATKETALLDSLARHNEALRRYEAQQEVLSSYRNRLGAMWRGAATVQAGEAKRAEHFSTQAEDATLQLAQAIEAERGKLSDCAAALAELRNRRRILRDRMASALRLEETKAQERAARHRPHRHARTPGETSA